MKKKGCIKKNDVLYWTLDELCMTYDLTKRQLSVYISLGALIRERLEEGLYYRVAGDWCFKAKWVMDKKNDSNFAK